MIVDGIGTCIAALMGSPLGTVVYIGHPAHKASGAKVGYSFANGIIYL
jgi:AGZA family xanthine/uracil permease-like MFS transporter